MVRLMIVLCVAAAGATASGARAAAPGVAPEVQAPATAAQDAALQDQLGGVVTDQTVTAAGKDFYQGFSALWHDMPLNEQFSIAIRERASARIGNRIQIEYANRTIFETFLPAARGNIRAISARAVEIAYQNVSNAAVQRLLFREQDLAGDEF
jgi:curli production assembly/transport component CsgE